MQALMLAAGMGKRLGKYTKGNTKCMLSIHDKTLIERAIEALYQAGITKFTIVVRYRGENLKLFQKKFGGYWRYPRLLDYCYLVNPYYPPKKMIEKINYFSSSLITQYPSGQSTQCINAGRLLNDADEKYLAVGNGAAELINVLGSILNGKMYLSKSVFNEYMRCFPKCSFNIFDMSKNNFAYDLNEINENISNNDIICLVNPDNPTGSFIKYNDIIRIIEECKKNEKKVIFDESFIDFVNLEDRYSLISNDILEKYDNLIVIKSISKSYGIPGLRLGVLATSNTNLLEQIKRRLAIWNINSYGEYYLQIANLYKKDYINACNLLVEERSRFIEELRQIRDIVVYNSEANYIMCNLGSHNSTQLAATLLEQYNIFIKDLRTKDAFNGQNFIRLAVRTTEENKVLTKCLSDIMKGGRI